MKHMNTKGIVYYLHTTSVTLRGGNRVQQIYYFSKKEQPVDRLCDVPEGFKIVENARTGMPVLKRIH